MDIKLKPWASLKVNKIYCTYISPVSLSAVFDFLWNPYIVKLNHLNSGGLFDWIAACAWCSSVLWWGMTPTSNPILDLYSSPPDPGFLSINWVFSTRSSCKHISSWIIVCGRISFFVVWLRGALWMHEILLNILSSLWFNYRTQIHAQRILHPRKQVDKPLSQSTNHSGLLLFLESGYIFLQIPPVFLVLFFLRGLH